MRAETGAPSESELEQALVGLRNMLYTGQSDPELGLYYVGLAAAGTSYGNNSWWAHGALAAIGEVPCVGALATLANSVLYDYESGDAVTWGTIIQFVSLILTGGGCFAAGTPLLTPEGDKPIESFKPGDWVLSTPEDDLESAPVPRVVEAVFQTYMPVMGLRVGGHVIQTTAEHPFWVQGRGWTPAQELKAGDQLRSHDGRWTPVDSIDRQIETRPVYNLSVSRYHTYFIGASTWQFSVWAHNAQDCLLGGGADAGSADGGDGSGTINVYTGTNGPVDLNRPPGPGTSGGIGGTHVTTQDLSDPNILPPFATNHIPGSTPTQVTQIGVPSIGVLPDPTGDAHPDTGWIAPNTPGATILQEWDVDWGDFTTAPKLTPK